MPLKSISELSTPTPAFCAVCRRHAGSFGFTPKNKPTLWSCGDDDCDELIKGLHNMTTPEFNRYEEKARVEAGRNAGTYLDSLDKFDLTKLGEAEWNEFLERIIDGFGASLRHQMVADRDKRHG